MSGHSKWSQIKHKKGVADQKKGQLFSKLSKSISLAARRGTDPDKNTELKNTIEKARIANMPKEHIGRAIKHTENKASSSLEELVIEALGPEGINIIIIAVTDNRNRTLAEIKNILTKHQGKTTPPGTMLWAFQKNGREFIPRYPLAIKDEDAQKKIEKTLEELDDYEDVQEIYSNY